MLGSIPKTPREAVEVQLKLRERIKTVYDGPPIEEIRTVAGCDVAYVKPKGKMIGVFVVLSLPGLRPVDMSWHSMDVTFPYIPGLLSFREAPVLAEAYAKLKIKPEIVFVDGQGMAHPRGIGLASHLGLALDSITVGVAKSRLVGEFDAGSLGVERGSRVPLTYMGRLVGYVLRTRRGVKPVFVSPGHRIDPDTAVKLTMMVTAKYRIPEPTRLAHIEVSKIKGSLVEKFT